MKHLILVLTTILVMGTAGNISAAEQLRHVVSFKFKSTASAADIKKIEEAFRGLKSSIKEVQSLEWGTNISPEKLNKGFTHCWILGFKTEKDRDAYLVHPAHKAFGSMVGPVIEEVFVVDFLVKQ